MDYFSSNRRRGSQVDQERLNAPLPPIAQTPGPNTPGPQTPGPGTAAPRPRGPRGLPSLENLRQPSSIRIRRLPSRENTRPGTQGSGRGAPVAVDPPPTGRRRSSSEPQRYGNNLAPADADLARQRTHEMPTIREGTAQMTPQPQTGSSRDSSPYQEAFETPQPQTPSTNLDGYGVPADRVTTSASAMTEAGNAARQNRGLRRFRTGASTAPRNEVPNANDYGSDVVDYLDLIGR